MTPPLAEPQPLSAAGCAEHGEGPVWDPRLQRLYWVDITNGHLHWLDRNAHECHTLKLHQPLGFVALTDNPGILVIGRSATLAFLRLADQRIQPFVKLEPDGAPLRCNDGKCDPSGRLWAGTMPLHDGDQHPGSLYSIGCDGDLYRELNPVGCSNGLAWHVSRNEFYFIDSLAHRIDRFRWDRQTSQIDERSVLARFDESAGLPDGMCIDANGNLWVAFWDGACIRHIDGRSGETLATIKLPVQRVTSCTFGGVDLDTLFITTSWIDLTEADRAAQPLAGSVFSFHPGVRGLPPDLFRRSSPP